VKGGIFERTKTQVEDYACAFIQLLICNLKTGILS